MTHDTSQHAAGQRSSFSPGEVASVCAHYELGEVRAVLDFPRGSRRAAKAILDTSSGRYLLKRRQRGRDDPSRVALSHQIQLALLARGFPAPRLIGDREGNNSLVQLNGRVYELFEYVEGEQFDRTPPPCEHAGSLLAEMHALLAGTPLSWEPSRWTFHADEQTRARLRAIAAQGHDVAALVSLYKRAAVEADRGPPAGEDGILHGDWHPGNMIFRAGRVVAVVDFDSARTGPRLHDLANGALQFALARVGLDADQWPDGLDAARFAAFCRGYARIAGPVRTDAIPALMGEAVIAETAAAIAETGTFGGHDPAPFLRMAARKATWLLDHAPGLAALADQSMREASRDPG